MKKVLTNRPFLLVTAGALLGLCFWQYARSNESAETRTVSGYHWQGSEDNVRDQVANKIRRHIIINRDHTGDDAPDIHIRIPEINIPEIHADVDLDGLEETLEAALAHVDVDLENLDETISEALAAAEEALQNAEEALKEADVHFNADVHVHRDRDYDDGQQADRIVLDESFSVSEGQNLRVDVPSAHVELINGTNNRVEIEIELEARDMERAMDFYESLNIEARKSGSTVVLEGESHNGSWSWRRKGGANITVRIKAPERFNVDVKTSGGHIQASQINGETSLNTSGGHIKVRSVRGEMINIRTSGGHIEMGEIRGARVEVKTSGGHIEGRHLAGQDVLEISTSGGHINLREVNGTRSIVKTSGGSIDVDRVTGGIKASTSGGHIEVTLVDPTHDVSLRTSGGSIKIYAPLSLSADVDLSGGRVNLSGGFEFSGELKRRKAEGRINGGGIDISARTSGGSVTFSRR